MDILANEVGIDAHKENLVVSIGCQRAFPVANKEDEIERLILKLPRPCVVHLEASGGYERLACKLFSEAGIEVRVHNPLKARRLFQGLGTNGKTDPVDAKALAKSARLLPVQEKKSHERQALADLSRAIKSVKEDIAKHLKRSQMPELDAQAKAFYEATIQSLRKLVRQFQNDYYARLQESSLAQEFKLLQSIPTIGKVTAGICLAELPEDFKTRTPAQLCSYAGMAPMDESSGKRKLPARIRKGNVRLKAAFYMPALSAIVSEPWAKDLYGRLRAQGKDHQAAIVPVMRRLLVRIHAVLVRGTAWQAAPPSPVRT